MELNEFVALVPGFASLGHPDKILHFAWFLHKHKQKASFTQADIRGCYVDRHMDPPNLSDSFTRLLAKKPKVMLLDKGAFKLEHSTAHATHSTRSMVSTKPPSPSPPCSATFQAR